VSLSNGNMSPERPEDAPTIARLTGEWHAGTLTRGGGETASSAPALPADAVPGYELLGEIGRGGMGVVYRARHIGLNRVVALKMVLAGPHARAVDLHRFRAEAEAVAQLRHPNVIQVYDVGEAKGLPFLSLELCAGSLADRLKGTPWPPKPAAELVETLALAVQAAHEAGILHRDLKPANVLLGDGTNDSQKAHGSHALVPKITDFGLAKRLDGSGPGPTATGAALGTPSYMAPEQAGRMTGQAKSLTAGPTIDVYALGAILYELLTGRPPFLAASPLDTLLQVTRDDPVPPARLNPKTPRDLQTICLKCLEKDPARRYPTAAALADDLRRYQNDEPIAARPATWLERALKWTKRRPTQAALVVVSGAAVVALLATSWYFTGQLAAERDTAMLNEAAAVNNGRIAKENADRAEAEAFKARRNNYVLAMGQAQLAWQSGSVERLRHLIAGQVPKLGEPDLRGFEWYYWQKVARGAPRQFGPLKHEGKDYSGFHAVAFSSDGRRVAATTYGGMAFVWDLDGGRVEHALSTAPGNSAIAFRPDGRQLAVVDSTGVRVVDLDGGKVAWQAKQDGMAWGVVYALAGRRLAVKVGQETYFYDADGGKRLGQVSVPSLSSDLGGLAASAEGRYIVASGFPRCRLIDVQKGEVVREMIGGVGAALSPNGERLALLTNDRTGWGAELDVLAVDSDQIRARSPRAHGEYAGAIAFSPDGQFIATAGHDNTVRIWTAATCKELRRFQGGSRWNNSVTFSPDGRWLAVGTATAVEMWPVDLDQTAETGKAHRTLGTRTVALSATAGRVLGEGLFAAVVDDVADGHTVATLSGNMARMSCATFSADGSLVAAGFGDGAVRVWDAAGGTRRHQFRRLRHPVTSLSFSADGRRLAAAGPSVAAIGGGQPSTAQGDLVIIWDLQTGEPIRELDGPEAEQVNAVALSGNGKSLLTGAGTRLIRWWDVDTGTLRSTLDRPDVAYFNWKRVVAVSRDGRWAAAGDGGASTEISLFDTHSGKRAHTLAGHERGLRTMTFNADGTRLISAGADDMVRVWDVFTGQEVLSRPAPRGLVDVGLCGHGNRLCAVASDGTVRKWDGD
jgi:WD40 repeat protein